MRTQAIAIENSNPLTLPLIIGIGVIATASMGYLLYRTLKKRKQGVSACNTGTDGRSTSNPRSNSFACISSSYPLQVGTCHSDVKILQQYLLKKGSQLGSTGSKRNGVDGQFGEKTRTAALRHLGKTSFTQKDILQLQSNFK